MAFVRSMKCEDDQRVGPIISYLDNKSKERSRVAKAVVDGLSGKVLGYKEA